jgi:hypothetical protein
MPGPGARQVVAIQSGFPDGPESVERPPVLDIRDYLGVTAAMNGSFDIGFDYSSHPMQTLKNVYLESGSMRDCRVAAQ